MLIRPVTVAKHAGILDDAAMAAAAEKVGEVLAKLCGIETGPKP